MNRPDEILAVIPARGGSQGVPGKNIKPLGGRPLIQYAVETARGSRWVTRTIVSTDSEEIAAVARRIGADVPYLRPAEYATHSAPTIDVLVHALNWLREHQSYIPDVVVLLQPTAPLRESRHVDEALRRLADDPDADSIVSVVEAPSHYNPLWQLSQVDGELRLFAGGSLRDIVRRRQEMPRTFIRNGAIYATRRETILSGSLYGDCCLAYEMPAELHLNIDTAADWQQAEIVFSRHEVWDEVRHEVRRAAS